jgi:response regulator RpfG family c-di-GMP phosphodiesterase/PAS domain-containing protein
MSGTAKQTTPTALSGAGDAGERPAPDVVDSEPGTARRFRMAAGDIRGSVWLALVRARHRDFVRDAQPVAAHLAEELLPTFRRHGLPQLELVVESDASGRRVRAVGGHIHFDIPAPSRFIGRVLDAGLTHVLLDTRLGATEILESLLVIVHVAPALRRDGARPSEEAGASRWTSRHVARALLTDAGFQGFSTRIRRDAETGAVEIRFSPRDLFGARALTGWVLRRASTRDAREMLRLSTKAGFLAFLIMIVPLLSFTWHSVAGSIVWLICSMTVATWISVAVSTIGSVLYDRQRRDQLLRSYVKEIRALSDFAAASPKPLLKLGERGEILFVNPATRRLLERLGIPEDRAADALPDDVLARVAHALTGRGEESEASVHDRVIHYAFQKIPGEPAVVAAGTDITHVRKMERELRTLNEHLESIVEARALETQEATVLCLARLAEIRDPETGAHLERTKRYVGLLARQLATEGRYRRLLDDETIDLMMKTAPLHDIGKVGVPDSILLKPGRLSPEETEQMQKHPLYGGDALAWVSERLGESRFFELAKEIAYYHHERWDGTGYPEAIPLAARLMALADVYDALTSPRVYRPALPPHEVGEILVSERGRHFDPEVVDAFLAREGAFVEILRNHGDAAPASGSAERGPKGPSRLRSAA